MSKLDDTEFKGVSQAVVDFKDDVRDMLNNGKYQSSVATTGIPGWVANVGESAFYSSGSDRRLYLKATSSNTSKGWQLLAGFDSTLSPSSTRFNSVSEVGTGNTFSLTDHIHALSNTGASVTFGTPVAIGTANQAGTNTTSARSDHIHASNAKTILSAVLNTGVINTSFVSHSYISGNETDASMIIPFSCVAKNMYGRVRSAVVNPNRGGTVTLEVNGADSALTFTMADAASPSNQDTTNTVAIAAGDRVSFKLVGADTFTNWTGARFSVELDPN